MTVNADGSINVKVDVETVALSNVKIADATVAENVAKVNANGALAVELTGSNLQQPLDAVTMDFKGKTAGQTFDVPHLFRGSGKNTFALPTDVITEAPQANYGLISGLNGESSWSFPGSITANGAYAQQLFSFDLLNALKISGRIPQSWDAAKLKANVKKLVWSWVGYGVGSNGGASTNGATIKAWNGAWAAEMTNNSATPSEKVNGFVGPTALNFIDANGFVHLLAHSTHPSDGTIASTIYTDYVKLDVQLYGEMMLTDTARAWDQENKAIRTTLTGSIASTLEGNGMEMLRVSRQGALAANALETILDTQLPIDLVRFSIASSFASAGFSITPYNRSGVAAPSPVDQYLDSTGSTTSTATLGAVRSEKHELYEEYKGVGNFSVGLKRPVTFPHGCKILVRNYDASNPQNVAALVAYNVRR